MAWNRSSEQFLLSSRSRPLDWCPGYPPCVSRYSAAEMVLKAHDRQTTDDPRVADIPLLGDVGHGEVLADQPHHKIGIFPFGAVGPAELRGVDHPQAGMVAATALAIS